MHGQKHIKLPIFLSGILFCRQKSTCLLTTFPCKQKHRCCKGSFFSKQQACDHGIYNTYNFVTAFCFEDKPIVQGQPVVQTAQVFL
jgi:hypothetical protein